MRLLLAHELETGNCAFYDIGCGKGRVLLEAMKYNFLRVEGADISAALVEIARANIANARFLGRRCGPISIYQAKAEDIHFGDQDTVIYLFHPFDSTLMNLFVASILRQLGSQQRAAYILYYNPICQRLFDESAHFERVLRLDRVPLWNDEHACALAIYKFKYR
jgi:SAM-dependent methyltransferase